MWKSTGQPTGIPSRSVRIAVDRLVTDVATKHVVLSVRLARNMLRYGDRDVRLGTLLLDRIDNKTQVSGAQLHSRHDDDMK